MKTPEDRVFRATDEYSDFVMACRYKGNEREFVIASHDKLNEAQVETLTSYLSGEWFKKTYITGIMNDSDGVLSQHEEYGDEVFCQPLDELRVDRYIMMV
ncbi:hypothetical protein JCM19235_1288 [Vibrio maritimus]|uniref:Uncharacterized protein n=1 Tax=Vibrio maritimus TaxID=990268 RepID=A0A090SUK6_9VIBR|nr:hypothetical protein JCM19235_1288 [Vibrio maritimus]